MSLRLTSLSVLVAAIAFSDVTHADIVIEGTKRVRNETRIDFGPFEDLAPTSYTVQAGDTLSGLAEKHLGSAKRYEQIIDFNDGLTADTLKAGQTILMPPKSADMAKWMHFFGYLADGRVERAHHGQPLPHFRYWTKLWAVPHAKFEEFTSVSNNDSRQELEAINALRSIRWIAKAENRFYGFRTLPDDDPVSEIRESFTIESIDKSVIKLTAHEVKRLDKSGKPIAGAGWLLTSGNGILMLLSACGIVALLLIARRRAAQDFEQTPTT